MRKLLPSSPLHYLQFLLLFLMFFLWAVGSQTLIMFAVTQSPCAEAAAYFGASPGMPTIFQIMMWICYATIALLFVSGFLYRKVLKSPFTIAFHLILLLGFILLQGIFYSFTLKGAEQPTGYLQNPETVWSKDSDGNWHYTYKIAHRTYPNKTEWRMGEIEPSKGPSLTRPHCVWRDKKVIAEHSPIQINNFHLKSESEKADTLYNYNYENEWAEWPKPSLGDHWAFITHRYSALETMKGKQSYRPMSQDELARFDARTACIAKNWGQNKLDEICSHHLVIKD